MINLSDLDGPGGPPDTLHEDPQVQILPAGWSPLPQEQEADGAPEDL